MSDEMASEVVGAEEEEEAEEEAVSADRGIKTTRPVLIFNYNKTTSNKIKVERLCDI